MDRSEEFVVALVRNLTENASGHGAGEDDAEAAAVRARRSTALLDSAAHSHIIL